MCIFPVHGQQGRQAGRRRKRIRISPLNWCTIPEALPALQLELRRAVLVRRWWWPFSRHQHHSCCCSIHPPPWPSKRQTDGWMDEMVLDKMSLIFSFCWWWCSRCNDDHNNNNNNKNDERLDEVCIIVFCHIPQILVCPPKAPYPPPYSFILVIPIKEITLNLCGSNKLTLFPFNLWAPPFPFVFIPQGFLSRSQRPAGD